MLLHPTGANVGVRLKRPRARSSATPKRYHSVPCCTPLYSVDTHAAGVVIAMGSDAVMTMFGENTRELEWFVEAGFTPAEALQTATVNGARLLGQEDYLGRLAPGFAADIVAVDGQPLKDIQAVTRRVQWVMKGGEVVVDRRARGSVGVTDPDSPILMRVGRSPCTAH